MFQTDLENPWHKKSSADSIGVEYIRLFAVQSLLLVFLPHTLSCQSLCTVESLEFGLLGSYNNVAAGHSSSWIFNPVCFYRNRTQDPVNH